MHTQLLSGDSTTPALMELQRFEVERRSRSTPRTVPESSSWVFEAQREAVIDALLLATTIGNTEQYVHARHVGEWCARIAMELPQAPMPTVMRRCGVLASIDPDLLSRISDVREYADTVSRFRERGGLDKMPLDVAIYEVAEGFDTLVSCGAKETRLLPSEAVRVITRRAPAYQQPVVQALRRAIRADRSATETVA